MLLLVFCSGFYAPAFALEFDFALLFNHCALTLLDSNGTEPPKFEKTPSMTLLCKRTDKTVTCDYFSHDTKDIEKFDHSEFVVAAENKEHLYLRHKSTLRSINIHTTSRHAGLQETINFPALNPKLLNMMGTRQCKGSYFTPAQFKNLD